MRSTAWSVLISVALLPAVAGAADVAGFQGQRFAPATGIAGGFAVERPFVAPHLAYGFGLFLNWADDAVVTRDATDAIAGRPVDSALGMDVLGSVGLFDLVEVGVDVPVHAVYQGDPTVVNGQLVSAGAGIGDVRVVPKIAFAPASARYAIGFALPVTIPTGSSEGLRGEGVVAAEPKLLLALRGTRFGLTANGGMRLRPGRQAVGQEVTFGAAAQMAVFPRRDLMDVMVEGTGGAFLNPDVASLSKYPLEAMAGVVVKPIPGWHVYAAAGPGLTHGMGAADYRVVAGVRFAPRPARSSYADLDGDGIPDFADACPIKAEDDDGFEDGDGCPDDDNDRDGVADDDDECPDEPGAPPDGCPAGEVTYTQNRIVVKGKFQFESGSAKLKASSDKLLDGVALILRDHPEIEHVRVDGHTDDVGPADGNQRLSQRRADAVREALLKRGVEAKRLSIRGYGESRPIAPNRTKAGRSKNRRVEFMVVD